MSCQCLENANVPNVTIAQSTKNFIQPLSTQIYNDAITTVLTTDDCELYFWEYDRFQVLFTTTGSWLYWGDKDGR